MDSEINQRFDKIEGKLDDVAEALVTIARVEERNKASSDRIDRLEFRADQQEGELDALKEKVNDNHKSVQFGNKVFWIIFSTVVATLGYLARS